MKTQRNILIAFLLNLSFAVFEFFGGIVTGSVAILSDSVHDLADAASIGLSYCFERKSRRHPDSHYTYGYARYSLLGSVITVVLLLVGSVTVCYHAIGRLQNPVEINYNGMIVFAIVGVCVNFCAAFFTREGDSLNQRAVNLHMLEDVLGWGVVLVGAVVMRFTDLVWLDSVLSIGVAVFIFVNAIKTLWQTVGLFLEKAPNTLSTDELRTELLRVEGVQDVHHIHLWSMDGERHYATMHIVTDDAPHEVKRRVRELLAHKGICHVTLELEASEECCTEQECHTPDVPHAAHGHHHHHHHH